MLGNLIMSSIIDRFGRKLPNIFTVVMSFIGWLGVMLATNVAFLLAVRVIQGVGVGMAFTVGPLLVGECTSPKNRGAFLMWLSVVVGLGVLIIHTFGSYFDWRTTTLVCIGITIIAFLLAIISPESPSWLAARGRFDECRSTFKWLRGDSENDELEEMIEANALLLKANEKNGTRTDSLIVILKRNITYFNETLKKNEFYKPILIMFHVNAMAQWCGLNVLASYITDFIQTALGEDANVHGMVVTLDILRVVCNTIALIVIKKIKRRTMMFITITLNIVSLLLLALFTFARAKNLMPFDSFYNYYIGLVLIVVLTVSIAMGALPMSIILAGEIFPLRYKNTAGGFSCLLFSLNIFICLKTISVSLNTINIYGLYLLYAGLLTYSLIVLGCILPETKDKTLQVIEDEFRNNKLGISGN